MIKNKTFNIKIIFKMLKTFHQFFVLQNIINQFSKVIIKNYFFLKELPHMI